MYSKFISNKDVKFISQIRKPVRTSTWLLAVILSIFPMNPNPFRFINVYVLYRFQFIIDPS